MRAAFLFLIFAACALAQSAPANSSAVGLTGQISAQPAGAINVKTDCGAKGTGITDDAPAIQNCINRMPSTRIVYFPNGTYLIGSTVHLAANALYLGQDTANVILHATRSPMAIFDTPYTSPLNITLSGLTFDGGNFWPNGDNNGSAYGHITNCRFQNLTASGDFRSVSFITADQNGDIGGLTHWQIDHNEFRNLLLNGQTRINGNPDYDGDVPRAAIWAFGLDNTSLDHNVFDTVYQGIKGCQDLPRKVSNLYIGYNVFRNVHRMGLEIQGGDGCGHPNSGIGINTDGVTIEYNLMYNWLDNYWNSFGISWANPPSSNVNVHHNIVIGSPYYSAPGVPSNVPGIGYELGGQPAIVHDNLSQGPYGLAIGIFGGSTGSQVYNNVACSVNVNDKAPVIGDEQSKTNTNYHDNYAFYPCNNNGTGGLTATTSIALNGLTVTGSTLNASVLVTTINPAISSIRYLIDGTSVSSSAVSPYSLANPSKIAASFSYSISTLANGAHTLMAVATDAWGNQWQSGAQSFTTAATPMPNSLCTVAAAN